jgi:GNAT superfamily N-acetyltransferase
MGFFIYSKNYLLYMKIIITENQYRKLSEIDDPGGLVGHYVDFPVDDDISLEVWEDKEKLELSTIIVPKKSRKQGIGSEIMNMVISYADTVKKPIYLTPDTSYGGTSVNRLKNFYKRFGFTKNKDYEVSHSMVRYPKNTV